MTYFMLHATPGVIYQLDAIVKVESVENEAFNGLVLTYNTPNADHDGLLTEAIPYEHEPDRAADFMALTI